MKTAITTRDAMADAFSDRLDGGKLRVYSGPQPATPETSASGVLLCEMSLNATFSPASSGGVITANAVTSDTDADATGTAGYARLLRSDGTTAVCDCTVGVGSSRAVAGDQPVDQPRIPCGQCLEVEPDAFERCWPQIGEENVCVGE